MGCLLSMIDCGWKWNRKTANVANTASDLLRVDSDIYCKCDDAAVDCEGSCRRCTRRFKQE